MPLILLFELYVYIHTSFIFSLQIRQLFVADSEPSYFMLYCCNWLLPTLVLHGDSSNLSWVSKVGSAGR